MSWLGCHCVRGPTTHSPHQTDGRQSASTLKRNITQFCVSWYWLIGARFQRIRATFAWI